MPPRVDFYVSEEAGDAARLRLACRVTEKAYLANQKVVVLLSDADALRRFDEMLWTFGDGSFVPHDAVTGATASEAPVALTTAELPPGHEDVLINLADSVPAFIDKFARVAEFLDGRPEIRASGRERFKTYRARAIEPATHKV